jgi:hypothetical protein
MAEQVDPLDPFAVHDRESYLAFVAALIEDREASLAAEQVSPSSPYGPDSGGWENITIESFLFAALRWAEAGGSLEGPWGPEPSWQAFARFLSAGKVYE